MDGCVPPPSLIHQYPPLPLKHHLRIYRINTFMSHPVSVYLCICVSVYQNKQCCLMSIIPYWPVQGCMGLYYRAVWGCMGSVGLHRASCMGCIGLYWDSCMGCIGLAVCGVSPMTPVSTLLLMKQPCGVGDIRHISHHHHHQVKTLH